MNILPCIVVIVLSLPLYCVSYASQRTWGEMGSSMARTLFFVGVFWLLYVLATHPHGMSMGSSFRGVLQ
jgi:hypothetical protein